MHIGYRAPNAAVVLEVTNRITVMRHGEVVAGRDNDGTLVKGDLARMMCGRDLLPPVRPAVMPGAPLLILDHVSTGGAVPLDGVSLELRAGEIHSGEADLGGATFCFQDGDAGDGEECDDEPCRPNRIPMPHFRLTAIESGKVLNLWGKHRS